MIDRAKFFAGVRASLFSGKLSQEQVDGITAILDEWDAQGLTDNRWLAYMLGTAFHETGKTMQPVRETFADTDDEAIAILESSFKRGRLTWVRTPYWRKDSLGHSYLGRGLVQLTHLSNYEKFGLAERPDKAMEMPTAVKIMYTGMKGGMFTGKKLADFFHGTVADWRNARRIINGVESADTVAAHSKKFYAAIEAAR